VDVLGAAQTPLIGVLRAGFAGGLPLHVRRVIGTASAERHNVVDDVTGAGPAAAAGSGAGVLADECGSGARAALSGVSGACDE
jgi:hypothetical protein